MRPITQSISQENYSVAARFSVRCTMVAERRWSMVYACFMAHVACMVSCGGAFVFNCRPFLRTIKLHTSVLQSKLEPFGSTETDDDDQQQSLYDEQDLGDIQIPSTGISVSDEMEAAQKDRFVTEVVPINDLPGVAQLVTSAILSGSFEPVRYLVPLSPLNSSMIPGETPTNSYVLVDVPPFSPQLLTRMKAFIGANSTIVAMVVTNRDSIHYDDASSVYTTRRADVSLWKQVFPNMTVAAYRLDIPRDCRAEITQVLDGYGPFALDEPHGGNVSFVETGRPLTIEEWDFDLTQNVLSGVLPPDDNKTSVDEPLSEDYTPEAIRTREEGKRLLAVYTPGHSFGSVSFIFPELGLCCSGFTLPAEDVRDDTNLGIDGSGPALDCRGYITTSRGGIRRQMLSARALVRSYIDRIKVVLPSRGDPLFVDGDLRERKENLFDLIAQYERVGEIYEQLGITSSDNDAP